MCNPKKEALQTVKKIAKTRVDYRICILITISQKYIFYILFIYVHINSDSNT